MNHYYILKKKKKKTFSSSLLIINKKISWSVHCPVSIYDLYEADFVEVLKHQALNWLQLERGLVFLKSIDDSKFLQILPYKHTTPDRAVLWHTFKDFL